MLVYTVLKEIDCRVCIAFEEIWHTLIHLISTDALKGLNSTILYLPAKMNSINEFK